MLTALTAFGDAGLNITGVILAFLLFGAGFLKVRDHFGFRLILLGYRLLPNQLVPALALTIPTLEVALGAGLLLPPIRPGAAFATMAFFGATAGFISASLRAKAVPEHCGCFGTQGGPPDRWTLLRLVVAAVISAVIALAPPRHPSISPQSLVSIFIALELILLLYLARAALLVTRRSKAIRQGGQLIGKQGLPSSS